MSERRTGAGKKKAPSTGRLDRTTIDSKGIAMCRSTRIRPAIVDDAGALSRLAASTFLETFGGENTSDDMARYLDEAFTPEQQAAEIADPAGAVLVAEHCGESSDAELLG